MKQLKEWFVNVPWGKIALISWGNPEGEPVLLVHGRQDSAFTFLPLLDLLPDKYHYVAYDLPGHGKSDPFPKGVHLVRLVMVTSMDWVVRHLKWKQFIFIGHSLATETGLFFNAIYPGYISKSIYIDGNPTFQGLLTGESFAGFYKLFYDRYYINYNKFNSDNVYTKEAATKAVINSRKVTRDEANLLLSRNLVQIGEDKYRLTWDKRLRLIAATYCPFEYYYELFTNNIPPTLFIATMCPHEYFKYSSDNANRLISNMVVNNKNVSVVYVDATHDVHFTNPELIIGEMKDFLEKVFDVKSKL